MIGTFLYNTLRNNTEVSAIVGNKIYPLRGEQDVLLPAIIYNVESKEITEPNGMGIQSDYLVRITAYSKSYLQLDDICNAVENALNMPDNPTGYTIEACFLEDTDDGIDDEIESFSREMLFRILTHKNL